MTKIRNKKNNTKLIGDTLLVGIFGEVELEKLSAAKTDKPPNQLSREKSAVSYNAALEQQQHRQALLNCCLSKNPQRTSTQETIRL